MKTGKNAPHHAHTVALDMGYHKATAAGPSIKTGPASPATIGPDTIMLLAGHMPKRAHQIYREHGGKFPDHYARHIDNKHPGHTVHKLSQAADRELPRAAAPQSAGGPRLPMVGV